MQVLAHTETSSHGSVVFFDLLGVVLIYYPEWFSVVWNLAIVAVSYAITFRKIKNSFNYGMYVCIEVALRGDAHGVGRSNWAKGRDPSGSWVQYPNPAVPTAPRHSRWIILPH